MGALSRRKGAKYEQLITRLFRAIFGASVKRGIGQERAGGEIADVSGVPYFWVQTKHGRFVSIRDALLQAEAELQHNIAQHAITSRFASQTPFDPPDADDRWPLAIVKFNGEPDTATMRLSHFASMLAEFHAMKQVLAEEGLEQLRAQVNLYLSQCTERMDEVRK